MRSSILLIQIMLAKLLNFQELVVFAEKLSFFGLDLKKRKKKKYFYIESNTNI